MSMIENVAKAICKAEGTAYYHSPAQKLRAKSAIEAMTKYEAGLFKKVVRRGIPSIDYYEGSGEEYAEDMVDMFFEAVLSESEAT